MSDDRTRLRGLTDDKNIHAEGEANNIDVELDQGLVLLKTLAHQVLLDDADEVPVESSVNEKVDDLLTAIPDFIEVDVSLSDLEASRDPDAVDRDVDCGDEHGNGDLEVECLSAVHEKNRDSVNDNLQKKLDLKGPGGDCMDCQQGRTQKNSGKTYECRSRRQSSAQ